LVYRSIEHRALRSSEDVKKIELPERYVKYAPAGGFGPDLFALATAVVRLAGRNDISPTTILCLES